MAPTGTTAPVDADAEKAAKDYEEHLRQSSGLNILRAVNTRRLFRERGLTKVVKDSKGKLKETLDLDAIRDLVDGTVTEAGIVVDKETRASVPTHRQTLAGIVLEQPTRNEEDEWDALDGETRIAIDEADKLIWQSFDMTPNHAAQRRVAERDEGLFLVKTATEVFLTNEEKYVRLEAIQPQIDKFVEQASSVASFVALAARQVKGLQASGRKALTQGMKDAAKKADATYTYRAPADAADSDSDGE